MNINVSATVYASSVNEMAAVDTSQISCQEAISLR
jgi:hypothetical protein